jgi:hypothetical protein
MMRDYIIFQYGQFGWTRHTLTAMSLRNALLTVLMTSHPFLMGIGHEVAARLPMRDNEDQNTIELLIYKVLGSVREYWFTMLIRVAQADDCARCAGTKLNRDTDAPCKQCEGIGKRKELGNAKTN